MSGVRCQGSAFASRPLPGERVDRDGASTVHRGSGEESVAQKEGRQIAARIRAPRPPDTRYPAPETCSMM